MQKLIHPEIIDITERVEDANIRYLLDMAIDYRKGVIRKLAVEPFLIFLQNEDVFASRDLPLNHMVQALLDFLGVDQKRRPTNSGIRTIARDIKHSFIKLPAQHPTC